MKLSLGLLQLLVRCRCRCHVNSRRTAQQHPSTPPSVINRLSLRVAAAAGRRLVSKRHPLKVIQQTSPVVSQHLAVLDPLLSPVLVPSRYIVLSVLEVRKLVSETLFDKN